MARKWLVCSMLAISLAIIVTTLDQTKKITLDKYKIIKIDVGYSNTATMQQLHDKSALLQDDDSPSPSPHGPFGGKKKCHNLGKEKNCDCNRECVGGQKAKDSKCKNYCFEDQCECKTKCDT